MKSIISRIPMVFKATSDQASLKRARLFFPTTSKTFTSSMSLSVVWEAIDHETLVKEFLESKTSLKNAIEDLQTSIEDLQTSVEDLQTSIEDLQTSVEDLQTSRKSAILRLEALEKGAPLLIKDSAGELLLHCIGIQSKPHFEESIYFKREVFRHDIAEKVTTARTFLPSNLKLADFDRVINNRSGVYSMTAETLQLRVKECMDLFQKYPELVKSCSTEHAILSQYEVLHKGGII